MMVLVGVHIAGAATHFQPKILHAVLHPIFFAMVLVHLAVSMSKAFITLGIGSAKLVKVIDVIMMVVCSIIFIGAVVGFYLCLFLGVAR
jgi:protein-S-isoprenylcysteine O-methyltransferase Ste14